MSITILISLLSIILSLCSLSFALYSLRHVNRPIVIVRVTTHSAGNCGTSLDLIVENTGNRPAVDIVFNVNESDVRKVSVDSSIPKDAIRCFYSNVCIPVLGNGKSVKNAFWHLGKADSWKVCEILPIEVVYRDLDNRKYKSNLKLYLADDGGFAQSMWEKA